MSCHTELSRYQHIPKVADSVDVNSEVVRRYHITILGTLHHCVFPGDDDSEDQNEGRVHMHLQDFYCMDSYFTSSGSYGTEKGSSVMLSIY